jgi:DNA-binding response OmpR family regulator
MKKKILVISNSIILINYIKEELKNKNFNVVSTNNHILGLVKLRNEHPDLIILDYDVSSSWKFDFLEEKNKLDIVKNTPLIMLYFKKDHLDKNSIIKLAKYKINRILQKPLNIDTLFKSIEDIFNTDFKIDLNPCLVDISFDNDILFVRLSKGLNKDKINLTKYKILELKKMYNLSINKIYLIIPDIDSKNHDFNLLHILLDNIVESTGVFLTNIVIFTFNEYIKYYFKNNSKYNLITVTNNFDKAVEKLKYNNILSNFIDVYSKDKKDVFFNSTIFDKDKREIFKLKFSYENGN